MYCNYSLVVVKILVNYTGYSKNKNRIKTSLLLQRQLDLVNDSYLSIAVPKQKFNKLSKSNLPWNYFHNDPSFLDLTSSLENLIANIRNSDIR